jgi:hypothetical protein
VTPFVTYFTPKKTFAMTAVVPGHFKTSLTKKTKTDPSKMKCKTCGNVGHARSSSNKCPQKTKSKKEKDREIAGQALEEFVIKDSLTASMNSAHNICILQLQEMNCPINLITQEQQAFIRFGVNLESTLVKCRDAAYEVSLLDMLHVSRCCENAIPVPIHDQNYYYLLFRLIFTHPNTVLPEMEGTSLQDSLIAYRENRTATTLPELQDHVMYICSDLSVQAAQNYRYELFINSSWHIANNLERQWIKFLTFRLHEDGAGNLVTVNLPWDHDIDSDSDDDNDFSVSGN